MNRFEKQDTEFISLGKERRSITLQFVTFVLGFSIKFIYNIFLLLEESIDEIHDFGAHVAWCLIIVLWSGLPISYSFW